MKHEAFMLGTSKGKHHNKGFDLFITTAPIPDLNEKIIVFGQVIKGEDVVQVTEFALFSSCLQYCEQKSVFPLLLLLILSFPVFFLFPLVKKAFLLVFS